MTGGLYRATPATTTRPRLVRAQKSLGLAVRRLAGGSLALVDASLADRGIASAITTDGVALAWKSRNVARGYVVIRDEKVIARLPGGSAAFVDRTVVAGRDCRYIVAASDVRRASTEHAVWSMRVHVPLRQLGRSESQVLARESADRLMRTASSSTISWVTFIPQAKSTRRQFRVSTGAGTSSGATGEASTGRRPPIALPRTQR